MIRMATTMMSWVLTWTDPQGVRRASAVSYDEPSAEDRRQRLEAEGCTDVVVRKVKPGELPTV